MVQVPSPAVSFVGRHNSGKTTLIVKLIEELVARGHDVGSVKHHSHAGFTIDIPGKDSYRHRAAGACETVISCPGMTARVKTTPGETECADIVASMPGHDIVIVEGYRKSGLPTIEIMRAANPADARAAALFAEGARRGWPLGVDFTQAARSLAHPQRGAADPAEPAAGGRASTPTGTPAGPADPAAPVEPAAPAAPVEPADSAAGCALFSLDLDDARVRDAVQKAPAATTIAVVTDIPAALEAAHIYGIPAFGLEEAPLLATFLEERYLRSRLTVVIQAGGESRRMGRSKATVPFAGRPLICRMVERLASVADELVITTNEPENLEFLHDAYPELGIRLVRDVLDYRGALPGLYTALEAATNPYVGVIACDMIFASSSLLIAEAEAMTATGADVVVPVNKHGFEPFHAVYRRDTCLPIIRDGVKEGALRAQSFLDRVHVHEFPQDKVLEAEPMGGCFLNANTPEQLEAVERMFLEG